MVRKLTIDDDPTETARLIFATDPGLFHFLFGKEENAVLKITKLAGLESNSFSYRHTLCYEEGGRISGILIGYDIERFDKKGEAGEFVRAFSAFELVSLFLRNALVRPLISKKGIKGPYIQNICVDEHARGRGIGTQLIERYCEVLKSQGFRSVTLDVSFHNPRARKLYESLGFRLLFSRKLPLSGEGIHRMKKDL